VLEDSEMRSPLRVRRFRPFDRGRNNVQSQNQCRRFRQFWQFRRFPDL